MLSHSMQYSVKQNPTVQYEGIHVPSVHHKQFQMLTVLCDKVIPIIIATQLGPIEQIDRDVSNVRHIHLTAF